MAFKLVSRFRPGWLVQNPVFDLANEREVACVSGHDDESVISDGRGDQAVVQKAAAEASRAQVPTLDKSGHDERRPCPGWVARGNDASEILERGNPVLVVLPVICLVSGAGEYLLGNRGVLEQKGRATPLESRKRRITLVCCDRLNV